MKPKGMETPATESRQHSQVPPQPHARIRRLLADLSDQHSRRVAFISCFTVVGLLSLCGFGGYHLLIDLHAMAIVNFTMAILGSLNLLWLQRSGNIARAENLMLVLLLVDLVANLYGNLDQTGPYWFFAYPLVAFFLKGPRKGLVWLSAAFCSLLGVILAQNLGLAQTSISSRALVILMVALATVSAMTAFYQIVVALAEERLSHRTLELGAEVLQRQSVEQSLRRVEERVRFLSRNDAVTGLANRASFLDQLSLAAALARRYHHRFRLVQVDVDSFADLNTRFGHDAGDTVLRAIAQRLSRTLGEADCMARIGADTFILLIWGNAETGSAARALLQLRHDVEQPLRLEHGDFVPRISCGIAAFPRDGDDAESLLLAAEEALERDRQHRSGPSRGATATPFAAPAVGTI